MPVNILDPAHAELGIAVARGAVIGIRPADSRPAPDLAAA